MLTAAQKTLIARFSLGCIATVSAEGRPMVSPKGTFLVLDDRTLAFGHIRSPQTLANLRGNPACEVVFTDPFARKAVRVAGRGRIVTRIDPGFADMIPRWRDTWGDLAKRVTALVVIDIDAVSDITTPPYDDGATEDEMIALYKAKYAEIYP